VLLDLAACERRADFSRPCGARFTDLAAQVTVDERLADMREKAIGTRLGEMATGTWDKLEQVFEERVARALHSLSVPSRKDIDVLSKRVAELTEIAKKLSHEEEEHHTTRGRAHKAKVE